MNKSNLKVMTFVGTRPEIIRLSRTMNVLDDYVNHITVHTGQNYDYELNEVFYKELEIRKPDFYLGVNRDSLNKAVGDIIAKSGEILKQENPDAVLVLGDTNSCLSAYMARRMHIPIYHMEAGNRCFDFNVPEETNRRIIDHISDFNLVYTEHARRHLLSEGLPHRRIYLTGSPLNEVLNYYRNKIKKSNILNKLDLNTEKYFIVSVHREENVDHKNNLIEILKILNKIALHYGLPVIVSTHPRTRNKLKALNNFDINEKVSFMKPFGFFDYNKLQIHAKCAISDSGSISEESAILGFPAITLRKSMQRPEALDTSSIILTGLNADIVLDSIKLVISNIRDKKTEIPNDYKIYNTSSRVIKIILGTSKLSNKWRGIL